jgi:hypothetical protein
LQILFVNLRIYIEDRIIFTLLYSVFVWLLKFLKHNITEHCTSWYPTKTQAARIHLTDMAERFYRSNLTGDPDTFVFKTIEEAQLAGFDFTKDDYDQSLCIEFKEVKTGP